MAYFHLNKETFESHCPFGVDVESEIFNMLEEYFNQAFEELTYFVLGHELASKVKEWLETTPDDGSLTDNTINICPMCWCDMVEQIYEFVCKRATYLAIPSLDLVLTNNGFGVVNSRDIIPAVPERVNRLRQQCYNDADRALDKLIVGLPGNTLTREYVILSQPWLRKTSHLVWTAAEFDAYCGSESNAQQNRNELNKAAAKLNRIENGMADLISMEQFDAFVSVLRSDKAPDPIVRKAMVLLMQWLSDAYKTDVTDTRCAHLLLTFMESNIESFPDYQNSEQYAARTKTTFETTRKDGCFIFR